jgi:hypothetical protein
VFNFDVSTFQIEERKSVAALDYDTLVSSPQTALTEVCGMFLCCGCSLFVFVMLNIFDVVYSCFTKLPMVMAPPWVRLCLPVTSRSLM